MDVGIIFDRNRKHFCKNISRSPKPPSTKQIDRKPQEHANNFRNMHKLNASKNADIKHLIDILQFTERKQLQQTPNSKVGGGGARAARHIRIPACRRWWVLAQSASSFGQSTCPYPYPYLCPYLYPQLYRTCTVPLPTVPYCISICTLAFNNISF